MKTIHLFGTTQDLLLLAKQAEGVTPMKYVRKGITTTTAQEFSRAIEIPNFGKALSPSATACDSFLVSNPTTPTRARRLKGITQEELRTPSVTLSGKDFRLDRSLWPANVAGPDRLVIDQLENPDIVVLAPGGNWDETTLLAGSIGTASETEEAIRIMKIFETAVKALFVSIKAFFVGANAQELLKRGARLTSALQSPKQLDLRID